MEKDAETMLEMHRQIGSLQQTINNLRQKTDSKDAHIAELEQQLAALRDALVQIQKTYDLSEAWNVASAALQEGSDSE